tara:strand:+ start:42 stop:272 length:231 start_codon:yes stop_codon:yes gene_type:complete
MTDDIVARLRDHLEMPSAYTCFSAADEIERLRAVLQAIAQCPIPVRIPGRVELWSLAVQMQETAIAALKEGKKKDG